VQEGSSRQAMPGSTAWLGPSWGKHAPTLRELTHNICSARPSLCREYVQPSGPPRPPKKGTAPPYSVRPSPEQPGDNRGTTVGSPGEESGPPASGASFPHVATPAAVDCPHPKIFQVVDIVRLLEFSPDSTAPTTTTIHKFDQSIFVEKSPLASRSVRSLPSDDPRAPNPAKSTPCRASGVALVQL
jgi:hypothetical protein